MVAWFSGDYLRGLLVVTATFFLLLLFSLTPAPMGATMPFWAIIPVYYFSLRRSAYLPAWLLFSGGLMVDVIEGMPMGMHPVLFILFHYAVKWMAKHFQRKSIWHYWGGFVLCSLGYWAGAWVLFLWLNGSAMDYSLILMPWIITSAFYPMLHLLLSRLLPLIPAVRY